MQVYLSLDDKEMREIRQLQAEMDALKLQSKGGRDTSMDERDLISRMYNNLALQKVPFGARRLMYLPLRLSQASY